MTIKPVTDQTLKLKTWVLKVSIDCQGCKKKVQKVLKGVEGVYGTVVDAQSNTVTVTGDVDADTLIKRLARSGKHAELVTPEKKKENSEKQSKNKKQSNLKGNAGEKKADATVKDPKTVLEIPEAEETKVSVGKQGKKKEKQSGGGEMVVGSPVSTLQPFDPTAYYHGYHPMSTLPPLDHPTAYYAQPVYYGMDPVRSSADEYEDGTSGCFVM